MNRTALCLSISILLILTACQSQEKMNIGLATPLTGGAAFFGENVVNSAQLAKDLYGLDHINIVVEDVPCGGHGKEAVAAVRKMIEADGVEFIIGGMCSDETLAVAPILNEEHVVLVMPLTGGANIDRAGEYVFRNGPSDILAGRIPAQDLFRLGYLKVALVTDQSEYTLDIRQTFKEEFEGDIVVDDLVAVGEKDLRAIVTRILESDAQAILILTQDGVSAAYLVRQLGEAGAELPIFGNFLVNTPWLESIAGEFKEGVYIYDPEYDESDPRVGEFFEQYRARYGIEPAVPFHSTGVRDALVMFAQAESEAGNDGDIIRAWLLENIKKWDGFNGNVTFDARGNSGTGFSLKQIRNGTLVEP